MNLTREQWVKLWNTLKEIERATKYLNNPVLNRDLRTSKLLVESQVKKMK